jgi:tape measure domain-containing protein
VTDFANLVLAADSRQIVSATGALDRLTVSGARAEAGAGNVTAAMGRLARQAVGVATAALSASSVLRASDSYTSMTNSLRVLGFSAEGATRELGKIAEIAQRTRAPLEATVQLYQRVTMASADLGASAQDVLRFTENIGLALAQQGGSAASASGALLQLSQALGGGTVRAEEFNSILEGAFPIAQAAARGIAEAGGSVSRLRQLVIDGKVSSDAFFGAILSQTAELEAAFGSTVPTISSALGQLNSAFTLLVGSVNSTTNAGGLLAQGILMLADNLGRIISIAGAAAVAYGGSLVVGLVAATAATVTLSGALTFLRAALIRTGIGALIVGAGELAYQFSRLVQGAGGFGNAMDLLGRVVREVWDRIAQGGAAMQYALDGTFQGIKAGFIGILADMQAGWRSFLTMLAGGFASIPGGGAIEMQLRNAAIMAGSAVLELQHSANAAREAAAGAIGNAAWLLEDAARPLDSINALRDAVSGTEDAAEGAADAANRYESAVAGAGAAAGAAAKDAEKLADEIEGPLTTAVDGVSRAFADFVVRGFRDFKGFVRSVLSSFKSMLAEMIATAARNRIMIGLGIGGVAGVAQAATGALGGGGGILGAIGGIGSALVGGFTNTLGAFFSGGLGAGFGSIGAQIGAGLTGSLTGIAGAIGAIAAPLLAVGAVFSFFRKKVKELDSGIRVTVDGFDALIETFRTTETSRFWGLSKKVRTTFDEAAEEVATPLRGAIDAVQGSVVEIADLLGASSGIFDGFTHDFTVSLKGLDEAARNAALEAEFASLGEAMLALVPDLDRLGAANMDLFAQTIRQVQAVLSQRYDLETRILQLQGDTAALRAREMERTVEFNRDLLQTIYDLEDGAAAMQAAAQAAADALARIQPDDFATAFDFQRAAAMARQGLGATQAGPMVYAAPAVAGAPVSQAEAGSVAELRALNARLANMETELRQYHLADLRHGKKTADTLEKWDVIGLPGEQA